MDDGDLTLPPRVLPSGFSTVKGGVKVVCRSTTASTKNEEASGFTAGWALPKKVY